MDRAHLLPAAIVAVMAAGAPAAADEGESALSVSAGYAAFVIPEHDLPGGGLGIELERGISDALWLRAAASGAVYAGDGGPSYGGQGSLGLTYTVDVLKYVPYLQAGLGGAVAGGGELDEAELHPFVELGAGLDILVRRGLSYGFWVRLGAFLDDSELASGGARLSWRWGAY